MKIRSIKPEFWSDRRVADLTPLARLLYLALWCIVDDEGRGRWLPKQIEGEAFPFEDVDILGLLGELEAAGRIVRYEGPNGDELYRVPTFGEHQHPKYKRASKLAPDPSQDCPGVSPELDPDQLGDRVGTNLGQSGTKVPRQEVEVEVEVDNTAIPPRGEPPEPAATPAADETITRTELKQAARATLKNRSGIRNVGAVVASMLKDPEQVAELIAQIREDRQAARAATKIDGCGRCDRAGRRLVDQDGRTVSVRCDHQEADDG